MKRALVGYTGFVGGTLLRARSFDAVYNSKNIEEIRGRSFDLVVCAGAPAVKWFANLNPELDRRNITRLRENLSQVSSGHFILISTIDVYRDTVGHDERDPPSPAGLHPYGLHRLQLEAFVRSHFVSSTVVRLPALFGAGLKKNTLFDLMTNNNAEMIAPNATFQWYPLRRIADDLDLIGANKIDLVNISAEPLSVATIHTHFFPQMKIGAPVSDPPHYDIRTVHAAILGGRSGYHLDEKMVLEEIRHYLATGNTIL